MIPESPLLGALEELTTGWYRPAKGHLSDEDKESLCQGDFYFGCKNGYNGPEWGIMLNKSMASFENKYGKAKHILTNIKGKSKAIQFENHLYALSIYKPAKQVKMMGANHLPSIIDESLRCRGTFKNGNPCTRESSQHSFYCGVCINE